MLDLRVTYIDLLNIASDSNFSLIFGKLLAFSKLAMAKFDPLFGVHSKWLCYKQTML